jgi:hypothetical protein
MLPSIAAQLSAWSIYWPRWRYGIIVSHPYNSSLEKMLPSVVIR